MRTPVPPPSCSYCGRPRTGDGGLGATCGSSECLAAHRVKIAERYVGWPRVTGRDTADFSRHNLRFPADNRPLPPRPQSHATYGGVVSYGGRA